MREIIANKDITFKDTLSYDIHEVWKKCRIINER